MQGQEPVHCPTALTSSPRTPRTRALPHSQLPPPKPRGLCLQPLSYPETTLFLSFSSSARPTASLHHPGRLQRPSALNSLLPPPRQNSIPHGGGGEGAQGRELGGCSQCRSGPLPDFFSIPGTRAHLVEEHSLAATGPTTPGGKPRILDLNRAEQGRERAGC